MVEYAVKEKKSERSLELLVTIREATSNSRAAKFGPSLWNSEIIPILERLKEVFKVRNANENRF